MKKTEKVEEKLETEKVEEKTESTPGAVPSVHNLPSNFWHAKISLRSLNMFYI